LISVAVGDDVGELVGNRVERCRVGRCGRVCGEFVGECLVLALEGVQACVEGG
jgi:hypothetical protein